ncbi:MAG: DUF4129 domain-containing protein [Nitrososphaerales archaeon]
MVKLQRTFGLNIRQETLYFSVIMAEICWLLPLILLFTQSMNVIFFNLLLLILMSFIIAFYSTRILQRFHPFLFSCAHIATALLTIFMSISFCTVKEYKFFNFAWVTRLIDWVNYFNWKYAQFPVELVFIIITCFFWIRGAILTRQSLEFEYKLKEFQVGIVVLYLVVLIQVGGGFVLNEAPFIVLSFYFFSLLALAISHLDSMMEDKYVSIKNRWLWLPLTSSATMLLLGIIFITIVSPNLIKSFLEVIIYLLTQLWYIILYILSLLPNPKPLPSEPPKGSRGFIPQEEVISGQPLPPWLGSLLYWLMLGLIFALVILILFIIIHGLRILSRPKPEFIRVERVAEIEPQRRKLINWLKMLIYTLIKLMRLFGRVSTKIIVEEVIYPSIPSARELYRQFLKLMTSYGYPRMHNETPFEYRDRIIPIIPTSESNLKYFTEKYVKARYGFMEISQEELRLMNEALVRINEAIKINTIQKHQK